MTGIKKTISAWTAALAVLVCAMFVVLPQRAAAEAAVWDGTIAASFAGGTGTEGDPYQISSGAELAYFAKATNDGTLATADTYFKLTADIDLGGVEWTPIGKSTAPFTGNFSGDGYSIKNLILGDDTANYVGLFGSSSGTVMNVGIESGKVLGKEYVGAVVGYNTGDIYGCYNNADVTSSSSRATGGICGFDSAGTISACYNTGDITGFNIVGGICGYMSGTFISDCFNTGDILVNGSRGGGIAGFNGGSGAIADCFSTGTINGSAVYAIRGDGSCTTTNCYYLEGSCNNAGGGTSATFEEICALDLDSTDTLWTAGEAGSPVTEGRLRTTVSSLPSISGVGEAVQIVTYEYNYSVTDTAQWEDCYLIDSAEELLFIAGDSTKWDDNIVLAADIDLTDKTFTPIGNTTTRFTGKFSGDGHTIKGLTVTNAAYAGVFGSNSGLIMNVAVEGGSISGICAGGICGENYGGTIAYCYNTASVNGSQYAGGICGSNKMLINNCYNTGAVSGNDRVGGICGYNSSSYLANCYNIGTVSGGEYNYVGGICGESYDTNFADGGCGYLKYLADFSHYFSARNKTTPMDVNDMTYEELCALDYNESGSTVWTAGAYFTEADITLDAADHFKGKATLKLPYLTVFGETSQPTIDVDVYNFNYNGTDDWQPYISVDDADDFLGILGDIYDNYVLTGDIDMADAELTSFNFNGKFSGNGHIIKNLTVNRSKSNNLSFGLFGHLMSGSLIMNVGLVDPVVSGSADTDKFVGAVCGRNYGTIANCYTDGGSVSTGQIVGGICGYNGGDILNCFNTAAVSGVTKVGGICGENNVGSIVDCYNAGSVTSSDNIYGAVCGYNLSDISNSYYNKDICTVDNSIGDIEKLSTLDMTASNALETMVLNTDVWGCKSADKTNGKAYYPYLKVFGEDSAPVVSYTTKLTFAYDVEQGDPVYGDSLYFDISALVAFGEDGEFAPVTDSYADGKGSFVVKLNGEAITESFDIYDGSTVQLEYRKGDIDAGEYTFTLVYNAGGSDYFAVSDLMVCDVTIGRAPVAEAAVDIAQPQIETALDTEPVVTVNGAEVSGFGWYDASGNAVSGNADYSGKYTAVLTLTANDNYIFSEDFAVTSSAGDVSVRLSDDLLTATVSISFAKLDDRVKPLVTATAGQGQVKLTWTPIVGATNYRVFSYLNGKYAVLGDTTSASYIATGLKGGVEYGFLVRAFVYGYWTDFTVDDNVYATPTAAAVTKPVLTATAGVEQVKLIWTAVDGATNYRVFSYLGGKYTQLALTTDTSFTATGLVGGMEYGFLVRALVSDIWTPFTSADLIYATPSAASAKPMVTAKAGTEQVKLTWNAVSGATAYRVFSYLDGRYTQLTVTTATSYIAAGLDAGVEYGFLVRAQVNGAWTAFSSADLVYASPLAAGSDKPVVTAVAGVRKVYLTWNEVSGATDYRVFSYLGGKYTQLTITDDTEYTAENLAAGTEYGFLVRALVNGTWTAFSTDDLVYATPTAPAKPVVTAVAGTEQVKLSWTAVAGAAKYRVFSYLSGRYTELTVTTGTTYTATGLTADTEYGFLVRAYVNNSWTAFGTEDIAYATPQAKARPVPVITSDNGEVVIRWNAVTGATNYRIFTYLNGGYKLIGTTSATVYITNELTEGVEYGFLVRAYVDGAWTPYTTDDNVYAVI